MKNSNKLFLGLILLLCATPFWYAFLLKQQLILVEPKPVAIESTSKLRQEYPISVDTFSYIFSDGVPVMLDTGQWQATLRTYEDLLRHCLVQVRNDTLYVSKAPGLKTMNGHWVSVNVKAPQLTGLAVINGGSIECDNPKTNFEADHLALSVGKGNIRLPVNAQSLNLHFHGEGTVLLSGQAGRLNLHGHESYGRLSAFLLRADSAFVRNVGQSSFKLHVDEYLEADLSNGSRDVVYQGGAVVVKKENGWGRVVDVNRVME